MHSKRFDISGVVLYHPRTMKPQPKQSVPRDEEYLNFIRSLPCQVCSYPAPSNAHHHPLEGNSSVGLKTSDYRTVPLCSIPRGSVEPCHSKVHRVGRRSFWGDTDVEVIISLLNVAYALRAL